MSFIGYPSPRTTGTQEGLAVLTEFLTQSMSLERMRRLADRTLAIKMAEDGADFCELYQFFLAHGHDESAAYDCARRVCRGGLVEGGAPFTKDVCYLDGLLRVTNFLRVALVKGHLDYVPLFFAGKIDVEDVPLFGRLMREGIVDRARLPAGLGARPVVPDRVHELLGVPRRVRPGGGAPPLRGPDLARRGRDAVDGQRGRRYFFVRTMSAWTLPIAIVMSTCNMCSSLPCTQYGLLLLVPVLSVVVMVVPDVV